MVSDHQTPTLFAGFGASRLPSVSQCEEGVSAAYLQVEDTSLAHRGQLTCRQGTAYLQTKDCLSADGGLQTCQLRTAYLQAEHIFPAHGGQLSLCRQRITYPLLLMEDILPAGRELSTCR
jgi:hypothetical protein